MIRPSLVLDIDDVCFDFIGKIESVFGEPERTDSWSLIDAYPKWEDRITALVNHPPFYRDLRPLAKLSQMEYALDYFDVTFVTARPASANMEYVTKESFIDSYHFTPEIFFSGRNNKHEIIKSLAPDIFIDDNPKTIANCETFTQAFLFTSKYNLGDKAYLRVNNWEELIMQLESYREELRNDRSRR